MHVLLVEDDGAVAQMVELMLRTEGFNVHSTDMGEEAVDLAKVYDYDVILLDLTLPDMSGAEVLRSLRMARITSPVIVLSGAAGLDGKVATLGSGADDYVMKPFHKEELVARMQAVIRRSRGHSHSVVTAGELSVDLTARAVTVKGARVHLTPKEYELLELLALRKGSTLTKEAFLNHLYGGMDEPDVKIIDVFVCKLRKRLAAALEGECPIETVWGRGYMLRDPEPVAVAA